MKQILTKLTRLIPMLLAIILLTTSCRSRRKALEFTEEGKTEIIKVDTNRVLETEKKAEQIKEEKKSDIKKSDEVSGDVEIKGSTDSANAFRYDNIANGDTLQTILISGKSNFIIKNNFKKTVKESAESVIGKNLNLIATVARTAVAQKTIKKVANEIKKVEKKTEARGFVFPVYGIILILLIVIFLVWFLWKKYGSGISERLKRRR